MLITTNKEVNSAYFRAYIVNDDIFHKHLLTDQKLHHTNYILVVKILLHRVKEDFVLQMLTKQIRGFQRIAKLSASFIAFKN